MKRKRILFKVNNQIILEESRDLFLNQIDEMKWFVATECSCHYDDVEVEQVETHLSEIDVDVNGLFDWRSIDCVSLYGITMTIEEGSDEYLDAVNKGNLLDYIIFI